MIQVQLYTPSRHHQGTAFICLITGDPAEGQSVFHLLPKDSCTLMCVQPEDWNGELSPWAGPPAFKGSPSFAGNAPVFLAQLISEHLPSIYCSLGYTPQYRALAGYSMAGLFALYAMTRENPFHGFASMSGSLWYPGWMEHLKSWQPTQPPAQVYLSLGLKEKATKNPVLSKVQACTEETYALLQHHNIPAALQWHPGGHFQDVTRRIAQGIIRLGGLSPKNPRQRDSSL